MAELKPINAAERAWRAMHPTASPQAAEYAYGVMQYRLGIRRGLPRADAYMGRQQRARIRQQVDAILAELRRQAGPGA